MKIQAKELQAGQVMRIEYGCPGNWVNFTVDEAHPSQRIMTVKCHYGEIRADANFRSDEAVEVVMSQVRPDAGQIETS